MDRSLRNLRGRVFPDHWSLLFGQISFFSFVVVLLTGVFLMFFYDASSDPVVYDGPYPAAPRRRDVAGAGLDAGAQFRGARRPADAPGTSLGLAADGGGDHAAPAAAVLHRLRSAGPGLSGWSSSDCSW